MSLVDLLRTQSAPLRPLPTDESPRGGPFAGIKAVVFDIYGTLIISGSGDISLASKGDRTPALRAAVGIEELTATAEDLHVAIKAAQDVRRADGITYPEVEIREVWAQFLQEQTPNRAWTPAEIERVAVDYECRVNPVWPMPDLAETLTALAARGLKLGIVSNAQFYTPLMFEAFLGRTLDELGFAPDLQVYSFAEREGKPSTALYAKLAERLATVDLTPAETLYIGNDLRNDVWPAQQVGFKTVLFAADARSLRWRRDDPRLSDVQPDAVVTGLWEILSLLG